MVGRKPKPAAMKALAGNPGRRPVDAVVPGVGGDLVPPGHLSGEALDEWRRVTADLSAMGVLGSENRTALAIYCQNWARMVAAERHVNEFGVVVPAPRTGVPMHNPHLAIANRAAEIVAKLAGEFGLTPSSRQRVGSASKPQSPASPWDTLTVIDGGKA